MAVRAIKNYIFYISDMEMLPVRGHFSKMTKERDIAEHIAKGVRNCGIIKSSEYDGSVILADSLGIVFPAHSWGISLAVYSFVISLRVGRGTHVYAVAAGENIYAGDNTTDSSSMDSFISLFTKNKLGGVSDIYVRCDNIKRIPGGTEEEIRCLENTRESIDMILNGLLYYNLASLSEKSVLESKDTINAAFDEANLYGSIMHRGGYYMEKLRENTRTEDISLGNVFLDEDLLAGVRLCRVM